MKCLYCMGYRDMNWELAGLSRNEIDTLSQILASDDRLAFFGRGTASIHVRGQGDAPHGAIGLVDLERLYNDLGKRRAVCVITRW